MGQYWVSVRGGRRGHALVSERAPVRGRQRLHAGSRSGPRESRPHPESRLPQHQEVRIGVWLSGLMKAGRWRVWFNMLKSLCPAVRRVWWRRRGTACSSSLKAVIWCVSRGARWQAGWSWIWTTVLSWPSSVRTAATASRSLHPTAKRTETCVCVTNVCSWSKVRLYRSAHKVPRLLQWIFFDYLGTSNKRYSINTF